MLPCRNTFGRFQRPLCTILVVEDHPDVRDVICQLVADAGHVHHEAANGQEALQWLMGQREPPCLILLDLRMPVMDGWDFLRALRADRRLADVPVIILSVTISRGGPNPVLPARAFWTKPPEPETIANMHLYCANHHDSAPPGAT